MKTAQNILIGISAALVCIMLIEVVSYVMLAERYENSVYATKELYVTIPDEKLGYVNQPLADRTVVAHTWDGALCYNVTYRTDELGRRVAGEQGNGEHLILFGDSITFGEGLKDEETFAYLLQQELTDKAVYNYGVSGYGPNNVLAKLEQQTIAQETSTSGTALYILIPSHPDRVAGNTRAAWTATFPRYALTEKGVEFQGTFETSRPLRTKLYRVFYTVKQHSAFLRLIDANLPLGVQPEDFELTAALLHEAEKSYEAQVNGSFVVVVHPVWNTTKPQHGLAEIKAGLARSNVTVLDFSQQLYEPAIHTIGCDPHPNAVLNGQFAGMLVESLA